MSTEYEFDPPEEFKSSNFLETPGTYHFSISGISTKNKDGKLMDGFRVTLDVLDGPRVNGKCPEHGKSVGIQFNKVNLSKDSKGNAHWKRQKQAAFFIAASIIRPEHIALIAERRMPSINLEECRGRQLIMAIAKDTDKDGKETGYMAMPYSNVWHVDDPQAASCPKNDVALGLLPKDQRRTPNELQAIKDAFGGKVTPGGNGAATQQLGTPVGAAADDSDVDIGDL